MKYVFDLEMSARALRLNRFLHSLTVASKRKLFLERPEEAMQGLSETEKDMVRRLDWHAMMNYGASFFCLERSEEHTSELQSRLHLVCRLLLEKKKKGT